MKPIRRFAVCWIPRHAGRLLAFDSVLSALLCAECLLFLSGHFGWLVFGAKKGCSLLVACSMVVTGLLAMFVVALVKLVLRRRFQFSVRSLLLLTAVVAVLVDWFTVHMRQAQRQQQVVVSAFNVWYDVDSRKDEPGKRSGCVGWLAPDCLRRLFGDDFFKEVAYVNFQNREVSDDVWRRIRELRGLRILELHGANFSGDALRWVRDIPHLESLHVGSTFLDDIGLQQLGRLDGLRDLNLQFTRITSAGTFCLEALPNLEVLDLSGTTVDDTAALHIGKLTHLKLLDIGDTSITDVGVRRLVTLGQLENLNLNHNKGIRLLDGLASLKTLRSLFVDSTAVGDRALAVVARLPSLRSLCLARTPITDGGLARIGNLPELESLDLSGCKVTDQGIAQLRGLQKLRCLVLDDTAITDASVDGIVTLTALATLSLRGSQVSAAGVARLRKAMPHCSVVP